MEKKGSKLFESLEKLNKTTSPALVGMAFGIGKFSPAFEAYFETVERLENQKRTLDILAEQLEAERAEVKRQASDLSNIAEQLAAREKLPFPTYEQFEKWFFEKNGHLPFDAPLPSVTLADFRKFGEVNLAAYFEGKADDQPAPTKRGEKWTLAKKICLLEKLGFFDLSKMQVASERKAEIVALLLSVDETNVRKNIAAKGKATPNDLYNPRLFSEEIAEFLGEKRSG